MITPCPALLRYGNRGALIPTFTEVTHLIEAVSHRKEASITPRAVAVFNALRGTGTVVSEGTRIATGQLLAARFVRVTIPESVCPAKLDTRGE